MISDTYCVCSESTTFTNAGRIFLIAVTMSGWVTTYPVVFVSVDSLSLSVLASTDPIESVSSLLIVLDSLDSEFKLSS